MSKQFYMPTICALRIRTPMIRKSVCHISFYLINLAWLLMLTTSCQGRDDLITPSEENAIATIAISSGRKDTPVPTEEENFTEYFQYRKSCLKFSLDLAFEDKSGGIIFNEVTDTGTSSNVYILDTSNRYVTQVFSDEQKINRIRISPNKSLMAYQIVGSERIDLVIEDFVNGQKTVMEWDEEWYVSGILKWANNQSILINNKSQENSKSITALNILTNEKTVLPSIFPNLVYVSFHGYSFSPEYDTTLSYVIYPVDSDEKTGYALRKTGSLETISFIPSATLTTFAAPVWSNNSDSYIISVFSSNTQKYNFELIYGMPSRQFFQITNLGDYIESYYIHHIVWSPDDRYVVFLVRDITDINYEIDRLMILDMNNRELLDLCLNVNYENWWGEYTDIVYPIWSPSSQELIVENQFDYGKNNVILINLSTMTASIIDNDKKILGWITLR
jgi:hypothetical protein